MKARIYNGEFLGLYTEDFLLKNKNKIINGELVSEWFITSILPNDQLIKPKWKNSIWTEGATLEEIKQFESKQKEKFVRDFMNKKKQDGESYASDVRFRITKELIGKPIAEVNEIDSQCQTTVMPILQLIEGVGADWWSAMNKALASTEPTNSIALSYLNEVKAYIINYVQTNYPKEL